LAGVVGDCQVDSLGPCVLDGVGESLGGDEVGGGLDLGGEPLGGDVEPDGARGPGGEVVEGGAQAVVEARRPETAGELAEVVDGVGKLGDGLVEVVDRFRGGSVQGVLDVPQGEPDGHETLLGAVVEVAGQSAPLLVGDGHDACPGRVELVDLAAEVGLERGNLEGQPARIERLEDQALRAGRVHHDGGQMGAGRDRGRDLAPYVVGNRLAVDVEPALGPGVEGDGARRLADRRPQLILQVVDGRHASTEGVYEVGHHAAGLVASTPETAVDGLLDPVADRPERDRDDERTDSGRHR
jgi:hypothetical protein